MPFVRNPLFFLAAGMFALGCEDYLFAGMLPGIGASLGVSVVAAAQGCAVFGVAYLASIPLCALLLSRLTARHVLMAALAIFLAGNVLTLFAGTLAPYMAGRFLAGVGSGLFLPVAVGAAVRLAGAERAGRTLSLMWGANSVGAVVGVPAGLAIAEFAGWRATVALILVLGLIAFLGIVFRHRKLGVAEAPPSLGEQLRLLSDRRVLGVTAVTLLTATGCLGLYSYISQVLAGTANSSDLAFSLWSAGGLLGSVGAGYLLDRFNKPNLLMSGILTILLLMIALIPASRAVPVIGLTPFLIWGAMGWASVAPQQYNLIRLRPGSEALAVALVSSAVSLGGAAGTALGGVLLAAGFDVVRLPYVTAIFVAAALLLQLRLTCVHSRISAGIGKVEAY